MTTIIPPAYVLQSEEALDKGYDPKIVRKLMPFLRPYLKEGIAALVLNSLATIASVSGP